MKTFCPVQTAGFRVLSKQKRGARWWAHLTCRHFKRSRGSRAREDCASCAKFGRLISCCGRCPHRCSRGSPWSWWRMAQSWTHLWHWHCWWSSQWREGSRPGGIGTTTCHREQAERISGNWEWLAARRRPSHCQRSTTTEYTRTTYFALTNHCSLRLSLCSYYFNSPYKYC